MNLIQSVQLFGLFIFVIFIERILKLVKLNTLFLISFRDQSLVEETWWLIHWCGDSLLSLFIFINDISVFFVLVDHVENLLPFWLGADHYFVVGIIADGFELLQLSVLDMIALGKDDGSNRQG